jgi:phage terminase large subunit
LAGGLNIVDFYEASGVGLDHYNDILRERARAGGYQLGACHVPHDAKVKEWGSGKTRLEQMEALGLQHDVVPDHRLMDGIGGARETLARVRFDRERCKDGIEALKQYRADYDEERKVLKPTPRHDWTSHAADAFRYLAMGWRDFTEPKEDDAHVPTGSWMAA